MRRRRGRRFGSLTLACGLAVASLLASRSGLADDEPAAPAPVPPSPNEGRRPSASADVSDLLVPTPAEWRLKYEEARTKLVTGEFAEAAVLFAELEATAVNRVDRAVARTQRTLADDWTSRNLTFVRRQDLADPAITSRALNRRSTDELVSLYTNSIVYGIGSALWLGAVVDPKTPAAAILPGLALTAGSIGTVLALDSGRGFHYGTPQSIVTGLWMGLEQGIVWTAWQNNRRGSTDLDTKGAATLIWGMSSAGAVAGGVLAETLGTTPGRSAWVGSTSLWTGAMLGFATGGLVRDGTTDALALGGIGLTAGTGIGLLTASSVSPSIGRVRLIDLCGVLGGVGAVALYVAGASNEGSGQGASGVTALGIAGGLAIGWFATSGMGKDSPRTSEPNETEPAKTALKTNTTFEAQPLLLPQRGGAMLGAGGTF